MFFTLSYNINITDREIDNPTEVQLPFDSYPGGFFNVTFDLAEIGDESTNNAFINLNLTSRSADSFNFIPTTTSLDVGGGNVFLNDNDYLRKYNSANPPFGNRAIPFDNFTTSFDNSGNNERHISFNTSNGNWLALELNDIVNDEDFFDCTFICDDSSLIGPDEICDIPRTFTAPTGATNYTWAVYPGSAVNYTPTNSNTLSVSRSLNSSGYITVQVAMSFDKCGGTTANPITRFFTKEVYLGAPTVESINEVDPNVIPHISRGLGGQCPDIGLRLDFAPNNQDVLEVEWEKVTQNMQWSREFNDPSDRYVILYPDCNQDFEFRVRLRNSCGWSNWQDLTYVIDSCTSDCGNGSGNTNGSIDSPLFQIYPVPADTQITVKIKAVQDGIIDPNLNFNIKLFNPSGVLVRDVNSSSNPTTVNVSNLPPGTYTLIPSHNGNSESHQILIN